MSYSTKESSPLRLMSSMCAAASTKMNRTTPRPHTKNQLQHLALRAPSELLAAVLLLLDLLPGLGELLRFELAAHAVLGLEFLHRVDVVVDQPKAGGLATTELRAEPEQRHARVVRHVVHLRELLLELFLLFVGGWLGGGRSVDVHVAMERRPPLKTSLENPNYSE